MQEQIVKQNNITYKEQLKTQFANDVNEFLKERPQLSLRSLLNLLDNVVDETTIRRNVRMKNAPSAKLLRAFYSYLHKEDRDDLLLEVVPAVVKKALKKYFKDFKTPLSKGEQTKQVDQLIKNNETFARLYAYTAFQSGRDIQQIKIEIGNMNMPIIYRMIEMDVLKLQNGRVYPGKIRSSYDLKSINALAKASISLIEKKLSINDEMEADYIQFEELNEEGLRQWVESDKKNRKRKMKIANNPKYQGNIKCYTVGSTRFFDDPLTDSQEEGKLLQ